MLSVLVAAQAGSHPGSKLILSNTVMGFAAGVSLILIVVFARQSARISRPALRGWAWTFAVLGGLLTVFGIHTCFSWPLLGAANLIFGEPAVIFGAFLIAVAVIIHQTPVESAEESAGGSFSNENLNTPGVKAIPEELLVALRPVAYMGAFTGPMLILLAAGGAAFGKIVFRPPPNEFPTGMIAGTGIESVYFIVTYGLLGLGAMILPVSTHKRPWLKPAAYLFVLSGVLLLLVTYASFMGHVSLATGAPPGGIPWPPK